MGSKRAVRYLSQADTRALLAWPEVIACLRAAYAGSDDPRAAPPKVVARKDGMWLRALTAISGSGAFMGAKIIAKGRPKGADHFTALWDTQSGELVCLMAAKSVTGVRTAGTSAVAIDLIARKAPLRLAILGSGHEASTHVSALAAVRKVGALAVYSPTPANRERFAARMTGELGIACRAAGSAREAVEGADIVIAAARSHDETPILEGAWLKAGIPAWSQNSRHLANCCFRSAGGGSRLAL